MRRVRLLAAAAIALLAITDSAAAHLEDAIDATASSRVISTATPAGQLPAPSSNVELVGKARVADAGPGMVADVATLRNYAYLTQFSPGCTADNRGGVYIIDIALYDVTNPLVPVTLVESAGDPTPGFQGGVNRYHSVFVWQQAGKAYLVGSDDEEQGTGDVDIFDISNPRAPVMISQVGLPNWPAAVVNAGRGGSTKTWRGEDRQHVDVAQLVLGRGLREAERQRPGEPEFIKDSDFTHPDPEFPTFEIPEGNGHYAEFDRRGQFIIGTDEDFSPFRTQLQIQTGSFAGFYEAAEGSATKRITTLPDQAMNDGARLYIFRYTGAR